MTNLKFPRKELEKEMKLNDETLEKINLLGIPVEGLTDEELILDVMPNRPDVLSMQGFLRAFRTYIGKNLPEYKVNKPEKNYKVTIDQNLRQIRPFTACAIVKNLAFTDEKIRQMIDIQERLHATIGRNRKKVAIGIYPLEKITLPVSFEARKPQDIRFIPLEESKEMSAKDILEKHPAGQAYKNLMDNLEKYPIFVDAAGKILSMPPIINSHETGKITESTKEVFIECSGFDFKILKKALNILVTTLADLGGEIYAMDLEYEKKEQTPNLQPEQFEISIEKVNKILGLDLKEKDIEKLLAKMGHIYKKGEVLVPAWRTDILHEVDIIEDIAIAYGYNNLQPELPKVSTIGEESKISKLKNIIAEILIGQKFLEISTFHLIKPEEAKIHKSDAIELLDSKSDYKNLRPNLMIPMLRILSENRDAEYPQNLFEIGTIFQKDPKTQTGIKEEEHLMIVSTPGNFTQMKQILDYLTKMLEIQYTLKETTSLETIEGRSAQIIYNNSHIGIIGEVHPQTLKDYNLKLPLTVLEISIEELIKLIK